MHAIPLDLHNVLEEVAPPSAPTATFVATTGRVACCLAAGADHDDVQSLYLAASVGDARDCTDRSHSSSPRSGYNLPLLSCSIRSAGSSRAFSGWAPLMSPYPPPVLLPGETPKNRVSFVGAAAGWYRISQDRRRSPSAEVWSHAPWSSSILSRITSPGWNEDVSSLTPC